MENYFPIFKKSIDCQCKHCLTAFFKNDSRLIVLESKTGMITYLCPFCGSDEFELIKSNIKKITPLESMQIDLLEHGQAEIWKNIETFNNPFHRIKARRLMAKAMKKIKENEL